MSEEEESIRITLIQVTTKIGTALAASLLNLGSRFFFLYGRPKVGRRDGAVGAL
jgi:hypothetical protein